MVFAIVGGAFIPMLTGAMADFTSVITGFVIPLACIVYIGIVALLNKKNSLVL